MTRDLANWRTTSSLFTNGDTRHYKARVFTRVFQGLQLKDAKERYLEKLKDIDGEDPYKIPRNEWIDDVDNINQNIRDIAKEFDTIYRGWRE